MFNHFNSIKKFSTIISMFALCGCANMNSIYREAHIDKGHTAIIDAKQRAIITSGWYYKDSNGDGTFDLANRRVCAEPSPDAMSVFASAGGFGASLKDKAEAFGKIASSESGANIGLRTHSIQLLRDSFYRTCEAYLNGGIDEIEYALQMRRFQTSMIALISIEQLTGVVKAPAVVLTASGNNETGDVLTKLVATRSELVASKTNRETAKATAVSEITGLETKISTTQAEIETKKVEKKTLDTDNDGELDKKEDGTVDAAKKTQWDKLTKEITEGETEVKDAKEEKDKLEKKKKDIEAEIISTESVITAVDKNIKAAETGNLTTVASGLTIVDSSNQTIDGETRRYVAKVVESITTQMISQDYGPTRCFDYLKSIGNKNTVNVNEQHVLDICKSILSNYQQDKDLAIKSQALKLKAVDILLDKEQIKNDRIKAEIESQINGETLAGPEDEDSNQEFNILDFLKNNEWATNPTNTIASNPPEINSLGEVTG